MKKFIKIFSISILAILLFLMILFVTPFLFKDKIIEISKRELNKMLTAEVDFGELKLSFIRNFPNAYVSLGDLTVVGSGDFEGDTLVSFNRFSVTVDIMSVIRMENIQVKSVILDAPNIYARVLDDGRANWDIMISDGEVDEKLPEEEEEESEMSFKVALNRFEIRDANITYRDEESKMTAVVKGLNYSLRGDLTLDDVDLKMDLGINELSFWMDGMRYMNRANVGFASEIAADLKNMGFTFKDNQFNLNEIVLKFAGSVQMPSDDIFMDVTFSSERTDFKSLLSLVPAVYMQDFASVQTRGSLTLNGEVKGTLTETMTPSAIVNLTVDNAMFKYPDLPHSIDNINVAVHVSYDGVVFDRTIIDVNRFDFQMAGNPFASRLHVKTPESDMQLAANFNGKIDFNSMAEIVPLEGVTLKGLLECDLALAGRMSTLENEQYEDFQAEGMLKLSGFDFESPDFPQGVKIMSTQLNFTPKIVELVNFDAVIGRTDISLNGSLENFIPFVFTDETVRGNLTLTSNTIDLNEFMSDEPSAETAPTDTVPMSVIEVPKNIDFTMNANIGTLLFDRLTITNTAGALFVRDGKVVMQNLSMNLLEGSMTLNGEYNTQNVKTPFINFGMDIRQFDITSALSSFSMLESMFPEPQNYVGRVSARLNLNSVLDDNLSPVLNSVQSKGQLQTHNLELRNSKLFGTMADLLRDEKWRTPAPGNLNINYEIRDGRVWVEPINMNISQAKIEISGDQGLDMTLNYKVNAAVPTAAVGATAVLSMIPGGSNIREFSVTGIIGGTVTEPDVKLSIGDMLSSVTGALREQAEAIRDQAIEAVTERVEEVVTQVREEVARQAEAIMAEAERQAESIRSAAKQAADGTRNEANAAADRIIREAASRSAIERRAAQTLADRTRSEGDAAARRIEQEADRNATNVLQEARRRADALQ